MRAILLRLHRWITLIFAIPLAVLIITGLILSAEPIMQDWASRTSPVPKDKLIAMLDRHDPGGKARGIILRTYENRMVLQGVGEDGSLDIELSTGEVIDDSERTMLSDIIGDARRLHEHFIYDLEGVVTASTIAMLVLIALGILMGWPRLRNSLSGWHQGVAWFGLPLLILSPLTGLAIAFGITFSAAPPRERAEPVPVRQALERLAEKTDPSGLIWLRQRGGRLLARVNEGGVFRVYQVSQAGAVPASANWPRALHEGNFAGIWSGLMVLATSLALLGLLVTGLWIYIRRTLRKPNRVRTRPQPAE